MLENKLFIFQRFTNSKEANIFSNDVIPFENYPTFKKYKYHTRITFDQQQFQTLNNVLKEEHNLQLLAENINDIIIHFENLQEKGLIHGNLTKLENIIISTRKCENKVHFVNYKFQNQSPNTNDEKDIIVLLEKPLQILKIQDYSSLFQIKSLLQASINQFGIGRGVLQNIWTFSTNLIWKTHKQHEQVDQELQVFKIDLLNSFLYIWSEYFKNKKLNNDKLYQALVEKIGDCLESNLESNIQQKINNLNQNYSKLKMNLDLNNLYSELLEKFVLISLQNQEQQNAKGHIINNLESVLNDTYVSNQLDSIITKKCNQYKKLEMIKLINDLI